MNGLTRLRNRRGRQPWGRLACDGVAALDALHRRHHANRRLRGLRHVPRRHGLSKRPASGGLRRTQNDLPRAGGAFSCRRRAPFRVGGVLRIGALGSSISRGAGLARTIRLRLSGPMAIGVISARTNIRHHTTLVTDNSPPMMAAPPPSGILSSVVGTASTISPVCGVRSRCHKQRGSTQHQQTLHDRLLGMRGPHRRPASYDRVRRHHRALTLTGRTFFRSCLAHNSPDRPRALARGKPLREERIRR
jgi:hypothetical protein